MTQVRGERLSPLPQTEVREMEKKNRNHALIPKVVFSILLALFCANLIALAADVSLPLGHGPKGQGDLVLGNRLKKRNDGGRFVISSDASGYSAKNDGGFFQSESEDSTWGFHGGLRDQWRVKVSEDVWWRTNGAPKWHFLSADDTPEWYFNEQVSDIEFMAADATTAQIQTITLVAEAAVRDLDTITFPKPEQYNIDTFQFSSLSSSTARDYIVVYRPNGSAYAASLNKSGSDAEPSGAIYSAIPASRKTHVNISTAVTAYDVANRVKTAFNLLSGAGDYFNLSDAASGGVLAFTNVEPGIVTNAITKNLSDGNTAASISVTQTTAGYNADGEFVVVRDTNGVGYGLLLESNGDNSPTPSSSYWTGLGAGKKIRCNVSNANAANQVAALAETCFGSLSGFSDTFTLSDAASDGTMTVLNNLPGSVSTSVVVTIPANGTSGFSVAQTTPGAASNYRGTSMRIPVVDSSGVEEVYYPWFKVGGIGSAPNFSDATSYPQVDVALTASANTIAETLELITEAIPNMTSTATNGIVTVTTSVNGQQPNITAETSPATIGITREGSAASSVIVDLLLY